jgi:hypothetical protein
VPGKGENAHHAQARANASDCDLSSALGCDTRAVVTAIDLHEHLDLGARGCLSQDGGTPRGIEADSQVDPSGQFLQSAAPHSRRPDGVSNEQVGEPGPSKDLGFADGGHRQPGRSQLKLTARDLHALVRLHVRSQCE